MIEITTGLAFGIVIGLVLGYAAISYLYEKKIKELKKLLQESQDKIEDLESDIETMQDNCPDCDSCDERMPDEPMYNEGYD